VISLGPREMEILTAWYSIHNVFCHRQADVTIKQYPGGGIGTVTKARCGCGKEIDITDYESW
jgi:hypothetical protein